MSTQSTSTEKSCSKCKEMKPLDDFSIQKRGIAGRRSRCRVCSAEDNTTYRKNNSEKCKESSRRSYDKKYNNPIDGRQNRELRKQYWGQYRKDNPNTIARSRQRHKKKAGIQAAKYRKENNAAIKVKHAAYYQNNKEIVLTKCANYRTNNKDKIANYQANHYQENRARLDIKNAKWYKDNPDKQCAKNAKRRAAKLQRSVTWANLTKIKDVYTDCAEINLAAKTAGCTESFVVDHIIPLQGKLVSGLHVENNLQIITATENCSKGNRFIPS